MKNESFFKRYEYKYLISTADMEELINCMDEYMEHDEFYRSQVLSLYYDTDDYRLIRRSLEKPLYKEKIRLRSYGVPDGNTDVFLEIKKKYKHIVYKRRIDLKEREALAFMTGEPSGNNSQIARELAYARDFYGNLKPKMIITSERFSYAGRADSSLRITFDTNICWRDYDLSLEKGAYGNPLLPSDTVLMEVKAPMALPMWLIQFLDKRKIRRVSFSKYGTAYKLITNGERMVI